MYALAFQKIVFEAIIDVVYFPLWWYSFGLFKSAKWCLALFLEGNARLAPGIWLVNIFVPMYGQYDWQGRIVSFFMRLVQIIFRGVALLAWSLVCVALFIIWLGLPLLISYGFYHSLLKG
ncbi:MAG: hypothetical protein AAB467_02955 [Patescibacteria group bacterium]